MELGTVGGLLSGAGSLLGGLGFGKKTPAVPSAAEQLAQQSPILLEHERQSAAQQFNVKMDMAKQHGLHPLAVLGVPFGGSTLSPAIYGGAADSGPDFAQIGHGAKQIANAFVKPPEEPPADPRQDALIDANVRTAIANANRAEWEALRTQFAVEDMASQQLLRGQPGNPPGVRTSNDTVAMTNLAAAQAGLSPKVFSAPQIELKQDVLPPHPNKLGYGAATDQALVSTMDPTGKPGTVLNQKAIQAEFNDGATMTLLTKWFGVDRAVEIMAALEQSGPIGAMGLAAAGAGKMIYDRLGRQARSADARRGYGPGRGRSGWRAAGPRNE